MKILGIDPGLTQTGFGVVRVRNNQVDLVDFGIIKPHRKDSLPLRLLSIYQDVKDIIRQSNPSILAVEDVFYGKNVRSLLGLGQARGAVLLAGAELDIPIREYSPRKVKQSLTGNGNAHKDQVQFMVCSRLKISGNNIPADATDALAIALCHEQQFRYEDL